MNMKILLVLVAAAGLSACASAPPASQYAKATVAKTSTTYRIGVDDKLQVLVWRNPDLSVTVPVRPDGKISVPLIGDVQAGGLTPMEVASAVRSKLSYYIRDPNVSIIVTDLPSHDYLSRVRITGAVRTPTSIPYRPGMTVLDAVLAAGGVNEFAAPNRTVLHRIEKSRDERIPIRLGTILDKGSLRSNIAVQPGDVIAVPERLF